MGKLHIPKLSLKAKKKSAGTATAALAACLVLFAVLIGAAIGRYQTQINSDGSVKAKEFYFTSDFLDGGIHTLAAPTPGPGNAPGSTEVSFTLGNHADALRFSEVEIDYTVTVDPPSGVNVAYQNTPHKLGNTAVQDDTVTISGLQAGMTYTVTATGKGGYQKELTATIKVLSNGARLYQYQETVPGEYTLLTVWNEGETAGNVEITYTGIPDNTNPNMTDWVNNDTKSADIPAHTSRVYRFFGGTVSVNGADPKTPN